MSYSLNHGVRTQGRGRSCINLIFDNIGQCQRLLSELKNRGLEIYYDTNRNWLGVINKKSELKSILPLIGIPLSTKRKPTAKCTDFRKSAFQLNNMPPAPKNQDTGYNVTVTAFSTESRKNKKITLTFDNPKVAEDVLSEISPFELVFSNTQVFYRDRDNYCKSYSLLPKVGIGPDTKRKPGYKFTDFRREAFDMSSSSYIPMTISADTARSVVTTNDANISITITQQDGSVVSVSGLTLEQAIRILK